MAERIYKFLWNRNDWIRESELYEIIMRQGFTKWGSQSALKSLKALGESRNYQFVGFAETWSNEEGTKYRVYRELEEVEERKRKMFKWFDKLK